MLTMSETKWTTDVDSFKQAVEDDTYAELPLPNGDTLITDAEMDAQYNPNDHATFNPYVEPTADHGDKHPTDILDDVASAIEDAFDGDVRVHTIEWDTTNDVFVPFMDRPTND